MEPHVRFSDYYTEFVSTQKTLIDKGITSNTWKTYRSRSNNFKQFLNKEGLLLLSPDKVNIRLIRKFEVYLRSDRNHCNDYVMRNLQLLKQMLNYVLEDELIKFNPFTHYKFKFQRKKKKVFLDLNQLTRIKSLNLPEGSDLDRNRDMFLFACYTGLSYCEIKSFQKKNTYTGQDGAEWIKRIRQKQERTGSECILPMLSGAVEILKKYGFSMPVSALQNMNLNIKKICALARVDNPELFSTRAGRKTFGNILVNDFGVDIKTVSFMMGHESVTTTEDWYVDVRPVKIIRDMRPVRAVNW
jgi:integrase/recombinase XerD